MTSAPRPRRGIASVSRSTTRRYIPVVYGRRMAFKIRSLPLCSGTWKWGAITGDVVSSSSSGSLKYAGRSEERRSQRRPAIATSRPSSAARSVRGSRSAP